MMIQRPNILTPGPVAPVPAREPGCRAIPADN